MLYVAICLSLMLLVFAVWAIWCSRQGIWVVLLSGVAVSLLLFPSPVLLLQCLLLSVAALVCREPQRPSAFTGLAVVGMLGAFGVISLATWLTIRELQSKFPFESMELRLPVREITTPDELPSRATARLAALETLLANPPGGYPMRGEEPLRVWFLQRLHEDTLQMFVNQPGFGVSRMTFLSTMSEPLLRAGLRTEPSPSQPGTRSPAVWSSHVVEAKTSSGDSTAFATDFSQMHERSVFDFAHLAGFGFFKDRRHVAGFQAHQFSNVPVAADSWKLRTLDLIGLVLHEEPVAYVSDRLPSMEELREAPIRPVDAFETSGLEALRHGDDLFARDMAGEMRVLGAIRSAKQCVACHGGNRGDLLGAFAYTLVLRDR